MDEEKKLELARRITDALPAPEEIRDDWGKMIVDTVLPTRRAFPARPEPDHDCRPDGPLPTQ